jgi:hypothetical protein
MVRFGLLAMFISSIFLFFNTSVPVASSYPIFANNSIVFDDTKYLYKERQGKGTNTQYDPNIVALLFSYFCFCLCFVTVSIMLILTHWLLFFIHHYCLSLDCNWIAKNPEERCVKRDSKRDYDRACLYCQATCFDAGFHQSELGYCYPLRTVSDIRFNKLPPVVNDEWYVPCDDYVNGCHKRVYRK